jgi:adenylylsulfate kinase-like enzyme
MVIWLVGLSGAGKTTLGLAITTLLGPAIPVALLDGDAVRAAIGDDLGYAPGDRAIQIGRLARLSLLLARQGIVVVVAAVYSNPALLAWNRANLPGYVEVHLRASLETLTDRDPKGLYARARAGQARNVVGLDIAWQPPLEADLTLDLDRPDRPEILARRVVEAIPALAALLSAAPGDSSLVA